MADVLGGSNHSAVSFSKWLNATIADKHVVFVSGGFDSDVKAKNWVGMGSRTLGPRGLVGDTKRWC